MAKVIISLLFFITTSHAALISTSPAITETLFTLGLGDQVTAVSSYCMYPQEVKKLPKVGTSLQLDWEKVVRLKAKTILLQKLSHYNFEKKAKRLGLQVNTYAFNTLSEIKTSIRSIASDYGKDSTTALKKIELWSKKLSKLKIKKRFLALIYVENKGVVVRKLSVVGKDNHYHDILSILGMTNASKQRGYPLWSREQLLKAQYDLVVIFNKGQKNNPFLQDPLLKNKKVILINGDSTDTVGPRVWHIMREVYEKISS